MSDLKPTRLPELGLPSQIRLVEVGLRDGMQTVTRPVSTDDKVDLVRALIDSGVTEIEAVSFAHPKVLPQFADSVEVMSRVPRVEGVIYRGLVPNLRGAERAAECRLDVMVALATTDEAVTRKNQNTTVAEVLAGLPAIGNVAADAGSEFVVGIANSFFAWGSGLTPEAKRLEAVEAAVQAGASGVYLACTTGMEDPKQVFDGIVQVKNRYPELQVGVHLHSRNGMALATALASMQAGVDWLEGSFGGLGGDLWAPGPPEVLGNAPLEDLVHLMDSLGVRTGVDLDSYLQVVRRVAELTGWQSTAAVVRGGTRDDLTQAGLLDSWTEGGGK